MGVVFPSVQIKCSCFVLAKRHSVRLSTITWSATSPVGATFCSAPRHPAAPPYASPTRNAHSMIGFGTRQLAIRCLYMCRSATHDVFPNILGMKRVCKHKYSSIYWSASRNEGRFSSRWWTAYKPLVKRWFCSPAGLHGNSFVRACTETCRGIPGHALG